MTHRLLTSPVLLPVLLVCGLLLAFLAISWTRLAGADLSWHGWIALALGCLLSLGLAGVLMGLLFHSNRSGADEAASEQSRRPAEREPDPD
ncbi:MAG: hypothetical protein WD341_20280 [Tistlia sp.]|uniref:hypothetical protein n=1 Tax=Tistlia sp. TaxID=3057121 RepID=UPI0034A54DEF